MGPNNNTAPAATVAAKPLIELHFPNRDIDNPTVDTLSCLSPQLHAHMMAGLKKGYGYSILQVARQPEDTEGAGEVREIRNPLRPFQFLTFPRPGKWEVAVFFFERTRRINGKDTSKVLERELRASFCEERKDKKAWYKGRYTTYVRDFSSLKTELVDAYDPQSYKLCIDPYSTGTGRAIAKYVAPVEMHKEGVFADDPHPFVKGFGNYFYREPLFDQCDFRDRLLSMLLGVFPWLIAETAKRVLFLICGFFTLLFMVKGSDKLLGYAFRPDPKLSIGAAFGNLEAKPIGWFGENDLHILFAPGALIIEAGLLSAALAILWGLLDAFLLYPYIGFSVLAGIGAIALGIFFAPRVFRSLWAWMAKRHAEKIRAIPPMKISPPSESWWARIGREHREWRRQHTLELGEAKAIFADRQAAAMVCGMSPRKSPWTRYRAR